MFCSDSQQTVNDTYCKHTLLLRKFLFPGVTEATSKLKNSRISAIRTNLHVLQKFPEFNETDEMIRTVKLLL